MNDRLSVQLWSVRDLAAADPAGTLRQLAALGFGAVEFAGFWNRPAAEVRKMLDDAGLVASGSHVQLDQLKDGALSRTVDYHRALGCEHVIIPWTPEECRAKPGVAHETAEEFEEIGAELRKHGLRGGYHCHGFDFKPLAHGKSFWQTVADETPADFTLQHDTANALHGGASATWTLDKYPARVRTLHLKEFSPDGVALGKGQVPLRDVLAKARAAGTEWLVIEHEDYQTHKPMDAVRLCLEGLKEALKA